MSYLVHNGKMVQSGIHYVGKMAAPAIPDKIDLITSFDGVDFASLPVITGSRTIKTRMYIPNTSAFFRLVWSSSPSTDYFRIDYGTGEYGPTLMIEVNNAANRRQYDLAAEGVLGVPFSLEVVKGTGTISSVKFNNVEGTDLGSSLQFGATNQYKFNGSGHASIWNLEIVGSHKWIGFPYGNTNGAWVDTIGTINGTIAGTPGTIDLTT